MHRILKIQILPLFLLRMHLLSLTGICLLLIHAYHQEDKFLLGRNLNTPCCYFIQVLNKLPVLL